MKPMLIVGSVLLVSGCADTLMSDNRLRDSTAMALNQPASAVTISDRHYDGMTNTQYVAHTPRGTYNCLINGGSVMALGMTNPPDCTPVGAGLAPSSASRLLRAR